MAGMASEPEAWLRGPREDVSPLVAPVFYSFQQAREDLAKHTEGLSVDEIWARPRGSGPVGFHMRHIGGSVERLMTYAQGGQLDERQLAALKAEMEPGASRQDLLAELNRSLDAAEAAILRLPASSYTEARVVGRKQLPTTVIGLLIHIAEHTQRHVGQAIITARFVRGASS